MAVHMVSGPYRSSTIAWRADDLFGARIINPEAGHFPLSLQTA